MRSFTVVSSLFALAAASVLDLRAACNRDNCLRAIAGTAKGPAVLSSRLWECSSYLATTVIPTNAATVIVATHYIFEGNIGATPPATQPTPPITITAGGLPRIATQSCTPNAGNTKSAEFRYSSACSCAGASPFTVQSLTFTATTTSTAASFSVTATGVAGGTLAKNALSNDLILAGLTSSPNGHLVFKLDAGHLSIIGQGLDNYLAYQVPRATSYPIYFQTIDHIPPGNTVAFVIQSNLAITGSSANGNMVFQNCGGNLALSAEAGGVDFFGNTCIPVGLFAVPLP